VRPIFFPLALGNVGRMNVSINCFMATWIMAVNVFGFKPFRD
jgi:hypothetical protein